MPKKPTKKKAAKKPPAKRKGCWLVVKQNPQIDGFQELELAMREAKARWTVAEPTFLVHIDEAHDIDLDSALTATEVKLG
ncbi:hypothetical protein CMI37_30390 [Candidatus Pacearchaeota archaeon]|nr:hypothetical protein [Candidatus Pacearchaeota archaeon]|tara:strand:- start:479 stop:718 length:240 start_codon:yes stop_codon:yes gene_type:complete